MNIKGSFYDRDSPRTSWKGLKYDDIFKQKKEPTSPVVKIDNSNILELPSKAVKAKPSPKPTEKTIKVSVPSHRVKAAPVSPSPKREDTSMSYASVSSMHSPASTRSSSSCRSNRKDKQFVPNADLVHMF